MTKYIVPLNIDFFLELSKLDEPSDNFESVCCITNEPLVARSVRLLCGHAFNYVPLYKDILNHKVKFNCMESYGALKLNEIRCPYCRNKQVGVLPYYEDLGLSLVNGVNIYDPNSGTKKSTVKCQFITDNPKFNSNLPEDPITNSKMITCNCQGAKVIFLGIPTEEELANPKSYCAVHRKIAVQKYKMDLSAKIKSDAIQAKQAKELAKQQAIQAKLEKKQSALKCVAILKTGTNKGTECGCAAIVGNLCKRHSNI